MVRFVAALLLIAGCGRISFDESSAVDSYVPLGPWGAPEKLPLSTAGDDPCMTGDLLELYMNFGSNDIYVTTRASVTDPWATPALIAELDVGASQSTPEVTPDGLTMYFASMRAGSLGSHDIWLTTRATRTDPWSAPVDVLELSTAAPEHTGSMTADRRTMVIDSRRTGTGTDDELFIATRASVTDPWGAPAELTALDASGFNDESPHITSDGLEIYFDSNRTGASVLYVSRRATTADAFGAPEPVAVPSTGGNQTDPWVSPDGHELVFFGSGSVWHSTR